MLSFDPFVEISRLHRGLVTEAARKATFRPAVDVYEDEKALHLVTELPGFTSEEVEVLVEDGTLRIKAERTPPNDAETERYTMMERRYGTFARSFVLPDTVDPEAIEAEMKDGLLRLALPKREKPGARKIAIQS
jgi:HSP20 family protein